MVRQLVETDLDARAGDHWADLADALSGHMFDVRLRVCTGVSQEATVQRCVALRDQPVDKRDLHADSVRDAQLAIGSVRHLGRLDHDHLVCGGNLEAPQMDRSRSSAILCVGVHCNRAAIEYHMDELG